AQTFGRHRAGSQDAALRAPDLPRLVRQTPARTDAACMEGAALARYFRQLFRAGDRHRRRRRPRARGLRGDAAPASALLRAPALRFRPARRRTPALAHDPRRARRGDRRRDSHRRTRARMRRRVSRRTRRLVRRRCTRTQARKKRVYARRVPADDQLQAAAACMRAARPRALPSTRRARLRRGRGVAARDRRGLHDPDRRLLRDGRIVRLRKRQGGAFARDRGPHAAAGRARRPARDTPDCRRFQLSRADPPSHRPASAAPGATARAGLAQRNGGHMRKRGTGRQPFAGSVVVVTGASAGVGRATAHAFARGGAKLGLIARGKEALEAAAEEVHALGGEAIAIETDVADAAAVEQAAQTVEERLGAIDIWVNNAMVTVFAPVSELTPEEFRRVTEVTYLGGVYGTMAALKRMRVCNRGTIVQVSSAPAYRSIH